MLNFGDFAFQAPWSLSTLLALPLLWHLFKALPPRPKSIAFPAVRLLIEMHSSQILSTRTPWWIWLLRSLMVIFLILAMARPVLTNTAQDGQTDSPDIIIVDNDWSVMDNWENRRRELDELLKQAKEKGKNPILLSSNTSLSPSPQDANKTLENAQVLRPQPWPANRANLTAQIEEAVQLLDKHPQIDWISNNLDSEENRTFLSHLAELGKTTLVRASNNDFPFIIKQVDRNPSGFHVRLNSAPQDSPHIIHIQFLDEKGQVLHRNKITLAAKQTDKEVDISLPAELKHQAVRLQVQGQVTPAGQYLLDEKWRDHPVGIIKNLGVNKSLLEPAYYVRKSLIPYTTLREADLNTLLNRETSLIFDVTFTTFTQNEQKRLTHWIEKGGLFIRFAGEEAARQTKEQSDPLMPVKIMAGERSFGGTLSWKKPARLSPFPENSPFRNLHAAQDITVKRQILARPETSLADKTWAQLEDGTPLITAKQMGKGWSVLFHVNAIPSWSNLPLSGTFEAMLKQFLSLSAGKVLQQDETLLPPYRLFDSYGALVSPSGQAQPLKTGPQEPPSPSQDHPPGLYGQENALTALNLGPHLSPLRIMHRLPATVGERHFQVNETINLAPWSLLIVLILALIDWGISLGWTQRTTRAATVCLCCLLIPATVQAKTDWEKAMAAANDMRLAYMVTGNPKLDETVRRGLDGLGSVLRRRTAVELAPAMAYNPEKDDPALFPMIYWAIDETQQTLSEDATEKLNRFLKTGGFILFDTMGRNQGRQLQILSRKLDIAPLEQVPPNHVLTRAFYLLRDFPGRFDHHDVWVESDEDTQNDRVSSVLVGNNGWAQAWARDDNLRPLYAVVPNGEIQREQAYRFGVNLVMYILSGNYKGDQVHIPAIMQRLGL